VACTSCSKLNTAYKLAGNVIHNILDIWSLSIVQVLKYPTKITQNTSLVTADIRLVHQAQLNILRLITK